MDIAELIVPDEGCSPVSLICNYATNSYNVTMGMLRHNNLFAWADESGNSGLNVFDTGQPMFWSGTLISPIDLDTVASVHADWLSATQATELHGKTLHFSGLNIIADSVKDFLRENNCKFVLTRIDKEFHVIATFVTIVFDSDVNETVAPLHDHVPIFRKYIANELMSIFHSRDRKEFWSAYLKRDLDAFAKLLLNIEFRVRELCAEERLAEIVCEALSWARVNPARIMQAPISLEESPNARALLLLVDGIHKMAGVEARVIRFRHDEQAEFGKVFMEDFEKIKNAFGPLGSPYAPARAHPVHLFDCGLELVSSQTSLGLQLIDVLLYLMSRHLNGSYHPREDACGRLLEFLRSDDRCIINETLYKPKKDFSFLELEDMATSSSLFDQNQPSFQQKVDSARARTLGL